MRVRVHYVQIMFVMFIYLALQSLCVIVQLTVKSSLVQYSCSVLGWLIIFSQAYSLYCMVADTLWLNANSVNAVSYDGKAVLLNETYRACYLRKIKYCDRHPNVSYITRTIYLNR